MSHIKLPSANINDIHLVQDKNWFLHSTAEAKALGVEQLAAIHGSPWPYDRHVPILMMGPGVKSQKVDTLVEPKDIAPTIATVLGLQSPRKSNGKSLDFLLK